MRDRASPQFASNPFSTKFIRPGALEFIVEQGESVSEIVDRLERSGLNGQILGPHGSGKSTLLWALRPLLEERADVHWTQVQPRVERRPALGDLFWSNLEWPRPAPSTRVCSIRVARLESSMEVVESTGAIATPFAKPQGVPRQRGKPVVWVIDGFDGLSWIVRHSIRRFCRRKQIGLLVTTHRDLGLPTLCQPSLSFEGFRSLVHRLGVDSSPELDEHEIQHAYDRQFPNVREALFELYDVYERRRCGQN